MIDVKQLFDNVGMREDISQSFDFGDYEYEGRFPFKKPVEVNAAITNRAKVVSLNLTVIFTASFECDRCLEEYEQNFTLKASYTLVESADTELDEDEYIVVENGELDLEQVVLTQILLELPSKHLCNEDCKGLCCKCGANLNEGRCACSTD